MREKIKAVIEHTRALQIINKECLDLINYMEESDEDELRGNLAELRKLIERANEILSN
ncbi:hypothetical protein [Campylobacter sp. US33a]|uniref:hypothetical protein n=1 Tax=Campylobacter sp. US33a TaxID=2498120 RepID=UPI001419F664|nr:hypothetical protein [Campylobacter sp. US33a]